MDPADPHHIALIHLLQLAELLDRHPFAERPEVTRLKKAFERRRRELELNNNQMYRRLYAEIYAREPATRSDILKIQFWCNGSHIPAKREDCTRLGKALGLSEAEADYLLTAWMDKSRDCYLAIPDHTDRIYWQRRELMDRLAADFYAGLSGGLVCSTRSELRHAYFMRALECHLDKKETKTWAKKIYSVNYDTEFKRHMALLGEIPRTAMLRHLVLFLMPECTLGRVQDCLKQLGYLPLTEDHSLSTGELLDPLIFLLLRYYEEFLQSDGAAKAYDWFLETYRMLDRLFIRIDMNKFRFLHFRALPPMI